MYLLKVSGPTQLDVNETGPALPTRPVVLRQNYPNPFNPETKIDFYLPRNSGYRLEIYNVLGQVVRRWDNPHSYAGWHTILWDGKDEYGSEAVSGIYLYRLQSGDFVQSKKMILLLLIALLLRYFGLDLMK